MSQSRTRIRSVSVRSRTPLAQVQEGRRHQEAPPDPAPPAKDPAIAPLGFGERMLRNTAVSVALLLTVVAIRSMDSPGAKDATGFLSQVVTMDLSESLGSLKFVSNFIPESAQVFWNLGMEKHALPTTAAVIHTYSEKEPWLGFGEGDVTASASGEVMSLSVDAMGRSSVRLRHGSGMETLYGNLLSVSVSEGDWVNTGDSLGTAKVLTYELRGEGRPLDPGPYLR